MYNVCHEIEPEQFKPAKFISPQDCTLNMIVEWQEINSELSFLLIGTKIVKDSRINKIRQISRCILCILYIL